MRKNGSYEPPAQEARGEDVDDLIFCLGQEEWQVSDR